MLCACMCLSSNASAGRSRARVCACRWLQMGSEAYLEAHTQKHGALDDDRDSSGVHDLYLEATDDASKAESEQHEAAVV